MKLSRDGGLCTHLIQWAVSSNYERAAIWSRPVEDDWRLAISFQ